MFSSRIRMLWCAMIALAALGVTIAAPPKTAAPKKKTATDDAAIAKNEDAKTSPKEKDASDDDEDDDTRKVVKTDAEWRKILTREQFRVARKKGTELAFGPAYAKFKKEGEGTYQCVCCAQTLFKSDTKFDSHT